MMTNNNLYNQVLWVTPYGEDGPEETLPGYGALVFMAPSTNHLRLVLIADNPLDRSLNIRKQLPLIMNGIGSMLLKQDCQPDRMLWYSCIERRFDRVIPRWYGRYSNGTPLPPQIDSFPCGSRMLRSFANICQTLGIEHDKLLLEAAHYGISLQD